MEYLAFLYFDDLTLVLKFRAVTNPFPDLPNCPFDSEDVETTSSESKGKLGGSGKELVTALSFKTKVRSQKYKKTRYEIGIGSEKDLSKIIKEFEKIGKVPYVKSIPNPEPTSRYFHLVRQLAKYMMRSDEHNRHVHGSYVEETAPPSNVNVTDEDESK